MIPKSLMTGRSSTGDGVEHAKSLGLPILRVYTGLFIEHVPRLGAVEDKGKFLVLNPGNKPFSLAPIPDISGSVQTYAIVAYLYL